MIKPLTSLRFFFAFFVFLSHLGFITTDSYFYNWLKRNIFFEGYLGVSFFFILSGFVLSLSTEKYINKNDFKLKKRSFYFARIFRIFPLHILTLTLYVTFFTKLESFSINHFLTNLLLLQSFVPNVNFYYAFNSPSWSISDEMFFYFCFPFLISFFLKRKTLLIACFSILTLLLIVFKSWVTGDFIKFVYYINPLSRLLDFIIGIFIFFIYKKIQHKVDYKKGTYLEILCIILFLIFFIPHNYIDRSFRYSIYYWLPMSSIILVFSFQKGLISKILSQKLFVYLGEISFAFYMIHLIVIQFYSQLKIDSHALFTPIILLILSLLLSILIFEFFEKPVNKFLKQKLIK